MKPIIFNTENVKAILNGTKTQTRRVIKPQPKSGRNNIMPIITENSRGRSTALWNFFSDDSFDDCEDRECPYGQVGDRLHVNETWRISGKDEGRLALQVQYKADMVRRWVVVEPEVFNHYTFDSGFGVDNKWRSSRFMPRWASRITLEITEVRVERLQEITEEDAQAEGISVIDNTEGGMYSPPNYPDIHRDIFIGLWDSLNAKYSWEVNPGVWVISFKVIK